VGFLSKPFFISTLLVSDEFFKATLTVTPPPPIKPKTRIKIKGKANPNITAEGLLNIALRLAFVIASIAVVWLYDFIHVV
jgi:hypothetical protein